MRQTNFGRLTPAQIASDVLKDERSIRGVEKCAWGDIGSTARIVDLVKINGLAAWILDNWK